MNRYAEYERMVGQNIGSLTDIDYLIRTYEDYSLTEGFFDIRKAYPFYRPVLGDGNCFYRAVAFSYLRQADLCHFTRVFQDIENYCYSPDLRISKAEFTDHMFKVYTKSLAQIKHTVGPARQSALTELFNSCPNFDTLMIMYLRSLNYREIHNNYEKYQPYINIDKPDQIENIKQLNQEAQGLQFDAMANALNVIIVTNSVTPEGFRAYQYKGQFPTIQINLFFRPGHYDIIYAQNSIYIKGISSRNAQVATPMYASPQKQPHSYRSSIFQNSSYRAYPKPSSNKFQQPQFKQNPKRQSSLYEPLYLPTNPTSNIENQFQPQRSKKLLQQETDPFHREQNSRGKFSNFFGGNNYFKSGFNSMIDHHPSNQKQQKLIEKNKLSSPIKSRPSQPKYKIDTNPSSDFWKNTHVQVEGKSKIQEVTILLLFFVIVGYFSI